MEEYKSFWSELSVQQKAGYIATGLAALLLLIFIVQNLHDSPIHFLIFDVHLPLSLIIIGSVVFGFCLSWLLAFRKIFRLKKEIKSFTQEKESENVEG